MPVVWSERCLLHDAGGEIFVGVRTPGTEIGARAEAILHALVEAGAPVVDAAPHDDAALIAVHHPSVVEFLRGAWESWATSGLTDDPGQDRVVPYVFAHRGLGAGRTPAATWARTGWFAYDTMTLVGPGTWEAARAAVDVALTAVDLVAAGDRAAYACCRPPGHHACRSVYGGSCYLNNTAVAAAALRDRLGGDVAVIDIDAHHGNGTQEIFAGRSHVRTASVHVDPAAGWFPHFLGFADETTASNLNLPLPPGAGDEEWVAAVGAAADWVEGAVGLVVALGVDAAGGDPESPLRVTADGFREAGRILGELGLPTVLVQEGGYDLVTIGSLVCEVLLGFEAL